jgi:tetratricopeptide (TPR) repeat protein
LREAVDAYRATLQVYTRVEWPQSWATTECNLGVALGKLGNLRLQGEESGIVLREAVEAFRAALTVYTRAAFPQAWATTNLNLAIALHDSALQVGTKEEKIALLQEAVATFDTALSAFDEKNYPVLHRQILGFEQQSSASLKSLQVSARKP